MTSPDDGATAGSSSSGSKGMTRTIFAGASGNLVEWFDFAVYGYMAPLIAPLFFPSSDVFLSLLAVYGAFAAGYLSRPLGAIVFGYLGDTLGRKTVLVLSVTLMGLCTVAMGLLPTFEQVGAAAGVLLVVLRILQGMSMGGEYTGSAVFVAEHAPPHRRGFYVSFIVGGAWAGFLLGSGFVDVLSNVYSDYEIRDFIWRLPFLSGAIILAFALWIRRGIREPELPETDVALKGPPIVYALRNDWRGMLQGAGLAVAVAVLFYMLFIYSVSYLTDVMDVSTARAMDINTISLIVLCAMPMIAGILSDRYGRKPIAVGSAALLLVLTYPLWSLIHTTDTVLILTGQLGFVILIGLFNGVLPVMMVELLGRETRMTAMSVAYNIPLAVFGGTTPLVATYLVARTADDFAPAYYLIAAVAIGLVAAISMKEVRGRSLG